MDSDEEVELEISNEEMATLFSQLGTDWAAMGGAPIVESVDPEVMEGVTEIPVEQFHVGPVDDPEAQYLTFRVMVWLNSVSPQSKIYYLKLLREFFGFLDPNRQIEENVFNFILAKRDRGYKVSVIWSAYSIVCSWAKILYNVDIMKVNSENKKLLAQWGKEELTKKSRSFTKADLDR
jgi:hypothetical protein